MKIDQEFAAFILIDILFERGLINKTTYDNVQKYKKEICTFLKGAAKG